MNGCICRSRYGQIAYVLTRKVSGVADEIDTGLFWGLEKCVYLLCLRVIQTDQSQQKQSLPGELPLEYSADETPDKR